MGFLSKVKDAVFGTSASALTVGDASVAGELANAGVAFGTLMEQVGLAVADSQRELDKNSAAITVEMCKAEVDIIRARQTVYGEDGKVKEILVTTGPGRLIELASAVFYEYKYVALQGEFTARELSQSTKTTVVSAGIGASGSISRTKNGLFNKRTTMTGSASGSATSSNTGTNTNADQSVGTMRMNALLAPKESTSIPKPVFVLKGPKISITPGATTTNAAGDRTTTVTFLVKKKDGITPNADKPLVIDTDGIDWEITQAAPPANNGEPFEPKTDASGKVVVNLKRVKTPDAPSLESKKVSITVRLGLVLESQTVTV